MPFACIFVPEFPVEAVVRAEPKLREQAVAVLAGKPPLVRVVAANEKAREREIEPGMTQLQAQACAGLVLRPRSFVEETAAHAALLDGAQSFSPRVEDTAADTVILDLAGLERLFGPAPQLARDLARRISDLGLEAHVAVARNPDAALHAARGFPGVTLIPDGKEAERLGDLPVDVLLAVFRSQESGGGSQRKPGERQDGEQEKDRRAQEILETLDRWGVHNFRTLAALPEIALSERLGQDGLRLQCLARGATERALVISEPALDFEEAVELEYPVALLEPLAFLLNRLLEQLCARLSARALATNELRLRMELDTSCRQDLSENSTLEFRNYAGHWPLPTEHCDSHRPCFYARALHLPLPMLNVKTFLKLLQLELQAHPPGAPVSKVWLAAEPVRPRAAQSGLFLPLFPEPEKLELTLARLAGVVGEGRAGSPEILDTHRPASFRLRHFAPAAPRHDHRPPELSAPRTALRLFRPPLRASVLMHAGSPVRITSAIQPEVRGEIVWAAGPWHASGEWWQESAWAREEWDIILQNETGAALYRLYREPASGQWFVEGSYD